ncbi:MAG TPA: hypothetical protein DDW76_06175 [Cyanobacteria bacterium UBA11369]|nr:hypothetical protein [Cyanobacteria bacterium UBA11371]HBE18615.1 hypothetical protein [Cyanobacteria bacterium UBA11367]HBE29778.1 hypothetical protein [Cyanobacteria bacterium UBA11368]HBE48392.1 hypothetical protein [Cyanobacteria bacterium UBA11369]
MVHQSFPPPPTHPFKRLRIYDGLMMNARRWSLAHDYFRRRQNVHYQSLNQPGIVCGLGVKLIDAPAEVAAQFRDRRWLEIQPGIAIDVEGNPIVVDEETNRQYRLRTETPLTGTLTIYLVVSYLDPYSPDRQENSEEIREWFRLDEKTSPPNDKEVELCRIKIQPGSVELEHPTDLLFPEVNELDLRYRMQAKARPEAVVRVAQIKESETDEWYESRQNMSDRATKSLSYLMQSVSVLYPVLQGQTQIGQVSLQPPEDLAAYDLLYLTDRQLVELNEEEIYAVYQYQKNGGLILIDAVSNDDLLLKTATEIIFHELETNLQYWQDLSDNHPLITQPFLFAALPIINQAPVQIWNGGGVILVTGYLSAAWGLNEQLYIDRNDIRTAQELGINILHFAWRRRQIAQLIQ